MNTLVLKKRISILSSCNRCPGRYPHCIQKQPDHFGNTPQFFNPAFRRKTQIPAHPLTDIVSVNNIDQPAHPA